MNIRVNARHMDITDAIRSHAHGKASKLERYFNRITSVEVIMDLDGGVPAVEVVVNASHSTTFVGTHRGEDMYSCIDIAMHRVQEQIRRHKDRVRDHKTPNRKTASDNTETQQREPEEQ